jgi:hypothetical protein
MTDPTRLVEEDGEHGRHTVGRELLLSARREGVPPGERDRLWATVAAAALVAPAIAGPASAASAGAGATVAASGAAALAKVTVAAVVLGAASLAGYRASRPSPSMVVAPAVARAPSHPAPAPPREAAPPRASAPEPARMQRAPARGLTTSHLAAEGRLVVDARRALREGDAAGALRQLEARRAEFVGGVLVQEREALTIEALARTGRTDAAAARADAFLRAYPHSPHAAAVRVFATP